MPTLPCPAKLVLPTRPVPTASQSDCSTPSGTTSRGGATTGARSRTNETLLPFLFVMAVLKALGRGCQTGDTPFQSERDPPPLRKAMQRNARKVIRQAPHMVRL